MTKEALKLAAQAVLDRWNSPAWEWHKLGPTGDLMADLQEALAQPVQPQRQWVGLTDDERNDIWKKEVGWGDPSHDDEDLMKAIEQALKDKNV